MPMHPAEPELPRVKFALPGIEAVPLLERLPDDVEGLKRLLQAQVQAHARMLEQIGHQMRHQQEQAQR